jgi:hypothetical protein
MQPSCKNNLSDFQTPLTVVTGAPPKVRPDNWGSLIFVRTAGKESCEEKSYTKFSQS